MPFAGYKNFEDCVQKTMRRRKWPRQRSSAYCAVIARRAGETLSVPEEFRNAEFKPEPTVIEDGNIKVIINEKDSLFIPPEAGKLPEEGRSILKKVYDSCRKGQGGSEDPADKELCAQTAWSAVKKAGWKQKKDGSWTRRKKNIKFVLHRHVIRHKGKDAKSSVHWMFKFQVDENEPRLEFGLFKNPMDAEDEEKLPTIRKTGEEDLSWPPKTGDVSIGDLERQIDPLDEGEAEVLYNGPHFLSFELKGDKLYGRWVAIQAPDGSWTMFRSEEWPED